MSGVFKTKKDKAPPPEPIAPIPDDMLEQANQERAYSRKTAGRGRSGTVLSQGNSLG